MAQPEEVQNDAGLEEERPPPPPPPPVYFTLKPQVLVKAPNASEAVKFYKDAFDAIEVSRTTTPKRKAGQELPHTSVKLSIGGSNIIVDDDYVPRMSNETGVVALNVETSHVSDAVKRAVKAGGNAVGEVATTGAVTGGIMFGCFVGRVVDPYGVLWIISSFPDEELAALADEMELLSAAGIL